MQQAVLPAALAVLQAEEELGQVSHSEQQMLFMRVCLPGETWVHSQPEAGAEAGGRLGRLCPLSDESASELEHLYMA